MGGLIQRRVTAHTGIWKVFFLSLHFLRDTILVFHRHLSSSNYFLPTCPSWYQLLASLFSAATFHHVLWARGESKRRIMQRRVPVRGRERESELVTSLIVHVPARSFSGRVEASLSQQSECGKAPPSAFRLSVSGLQGGWRA